VYFDDFFLKTPQLESRLDILELYVYCIVLKYDPYSQMIPWFQNNKVIAAKKKRINYVKIGVDGVVLNIAALSPKE
jgi:hypothetical protein